MTWIKKMRGKFYQLLSIETREFLFRNRITGDNFEPLLKEFSDLTFSSSRRRFLLTGTSRDPVELDWLRHRIMTVLRRVYPTTRVPLHQIQTGYYDRCLERYFTQRLEQGLRNEQTCWFRDAQSVKCIGWFPGSGLFDNLEKKRFVDARKALMARKCGEEKAHLLLNESYEEKYLNQLERDSKGYVSVRSTRTTFIDDKGLKLVGILQKEGFNEKLTALTPIILGFSTKTRFFSVILGRHRIAALRYLKERRMMGADIEIPCHVVEYDYERLIYTRPQGDRCVPCSENGIFDPEKIEGKGMVLTP